MQNGNIKIDAWDGKEHLERWGGKQAQTRHVFFPSSAMSSAGVLPEQSKVRWGHHLLDYCCRRCGDSGCCTGCSSGGGGCSCCFLTTVCLLLCIQTFKTCLLTPISAQNCSTIASSCRWNLHPTLSAKANMFSFCSAVNLVRNRFLDMVVGVGVAVFNLSSLDDSVVVPPLPLGLLPPKWTKPDVPRTAADGLEEKPPSWNCCWWWGCAWGWGGGSSRGRRVVPW